jgi:hypothetical protein
MEIRVVVEKTWLKEDQRKKLGFLESFRGIFVNIES